MAYQIQKHILHAVHTEQVEEYALNILFWKLNDNDNDDDDDRVWWGSTIPSFKILTYLWWYLAMNINWLYLSLFSASEILASGLMQWG